MGCVHTFDDEVQFYVSGGTLRLIVSKIISVCGDGSVGYAEQEDDTDSEEDEDNEI